MNRPTGCPSRFPYSRHIIVVVDFPVPLPCISKVIPFTAERESISLPRDHDDLSGPSMAIERIVCLPSRIPLGRACDLRCSCGFLFQGVLPISALNANSWPNDERRDQL